MDYNHKKTILFINDQISGGGVEVVMKSIIHYLAQAGYAVTLCAATGSRKQFRQEYDDKVRFVRGYSWSSNSGKQLGKSFFRKMIARINKARLRFQLSRPYDIAVAMKEGESMRTVVKRTRAKKKIAWIHTDYSSFHWTKWVFSSTAEELDYMKSFNKVVCVSHAAQEGVKNTIGDPGNLCVLYNPVDAERIRRLAEDEVEYKKNEDRFLFVAVGRLDAHKQFALLLDACKQLMREFEFELWIIGDGPQKSELQSKIVDEDISVVRLLGHQANPYNYMKQGNCVICCSKSESYGLVIQEALILGIPVISTSFSAAKETLNQNFGLIVDNSYEGLVQGMRAVLEKSELVNSLTCNIRNHFETEGLYEERLHSIAKLLEE